jgi:hypothetical protein
LPKSKYLGYQQWNGGSQVHPNIKSWVYQLFQVERAMLLVAMATSKDMKINAKHVDEWVP